MKEMNLESGKSFPWGKVALFSIAGYVLWANRFRVQEILESNGIKTPWLNGTVGDTLMSGAAKASGIVKHEVNPSPMM